MAFNAVLRVVHSFLSQVRFRLMNLQRLLQRRFHDALSSLVADPGPYLDMIKPAQDPKHGDYQANFAMSLKKVLAKPPRTIAEEVVGRLKVDDLLQPPEIAGPGFINLRFKDDWLAAQLQICAADERLGVQFADPRKTFVIDFSSPNVAKPTCFFRPPVIPHKHLSDRGTTNELFLYAQKHFRDEPTLKADPAPDLM